MLLDGGNPNPIRLKESNLGDLVADGFLRRGQPHRGGRRPPGGQRRVLQRRRHPHLDRRPATSPRRARSTCCRSTTCSSRCRTSPPARFKELMEWGVGRAAGAPTARFPQIAGFKMTVDTTRTAAGPGRAVQRHHAGPAHHVAHARRRHARSSRTARWSPGAPNVNLATTNFTANNGDSYPFRDLKGVAAGVPYQQSLYDYIVKDLGGAVTAAKYPVGGYRPHHDHSRSGARCSECGATVLPGPPRCCAAMRSARALRLRRSARARRSCGPGARGRCAG